MFLVVSMLTHKTCPSASPLVLLSAWQDLGSHRLLLASRTNCTSTTSRSWVLLTQRYHIFDAVMSLAALSTFGLLTARLTGRLSLDLPDTKEIPNS